MSEPVRRVVVTGATGFVGTHLVRRLRSERLSVLGLVRALPANHSSAHGIEYVSRNLEDVATLRDVLVPGDVIVHLASRVHIMRDTDPASEDAYRRLNVEATRMLCRSASERGARRVIYLSSAKVFGEGADRAYRRTDALAPADVYSRSKVEAESVVREVSDQGGVPWTIFRPPFVYGAGGRGNFPRLVALARLATRIPLPLASIENRRSILFVGNLVDAILRCGFDDRAAGQVLLPTDARDVSTPDLLRAIAKVGSARALLFPCPPALLRAAAAVAGRAAEMDRLTESLQLESRHLREELSWDPPFSLERALEHSIDATRLTAKRIDDE